MDREVSLLRQLREEAGKNSLEDRYTVGYLAAIHDFLNIEPEEVNIDVR